MQEAICYSDFVFTSFPVLLGLRCVQETFTTAACITYSMVFFFFFFFFRCPAQGGVLVRVGRTEWGRSLLCHSLLGLL